MGANLISERFEPDFPDYLNGALSTLTGIYYALVGMNLTQSLWTGGAVRRTLKAGRLDIAHGRFGDGGGLAWRSRMMHRIALLTPRLARAEPDADRAISDTLRDMMTGLSVARLAGLHAQLTPELASEADDILDSIRKYFGHLARLPSLAPPESLLANIDHGLDLVSNDPSSSVRRDGVLALLSLRRNMFPAVNAS